MQKTRQREVPTILYYTIYITYVFLEFRTQRDLKGVSVRPSSYCSMTHTLILIIHYTRVVI